MHKFLQQIRDNKELLNLEEAGFRRGDEKIKTMDVSSNDLKGSLYKQLMDYLYAPNVDETKRSLADLRNVAGCLFLKLVEEESKSE